MKRKLNFFMLMVIGLLFTSSYLNGQNNTSEGFVKGTIEGTIHEEKYDESQSRTTVTISGMPANLEAFLDLQKQIAVTPQGGVVMILVAIYMYQNDPDVGMQCLTAASTYPLTSKSEKKGSYEGYIMTNISRLKTNLESYPRIPFVYYQGASPENGYVPDGPPYVVKMYTNPYSYSKGSDGMRVKLFAETQGADSNRPCTVKKVDDIYKVTEYSSFYLSYKPIK